MSRVCQALFILTALLLSAQSYAQPLFFEGMPVQEINIIVANSDMPARNVRSHMVTKEGDFFSQATFDNDLKMLAQEFDRIDPSIEIIDQKIFVTIKLELRPHIRKIKFQGNKTATSKTLLKELGIKSGDVFNRVAFSKAFHKLKNYYVSNGYFEAELSYELERDPCVNEVDLIISIDEGRSGKIRKICFHNFSPYEQNEILDLMRTKKWNFFLSWYSGDGIYHEDMILADQYAVINYLQNKGYADANVLINVKEIPDSNKIELHVTADRGEVYRVGKVNFEGNAVFSDEEISRCFCVHEGNPYSPEGLISTIKNITDKYGACGYIETIVDYELELDQNEPVYSINLRIDEGEQYYVGLIKIFGNCSTFNSVILHETLMTPGELFNIQLLKATEERLECIGYFKSVNVYTVRSEGPCGLGERYRDVHIEVEETTTGSFNAFAGVSNAETFFSGIQVTEKNFNLAGLFTLGSKGIKGLRGGGEYFHFTTSIGQKSQSYVISWTKPYFMDSMWITGFDLEKSETRYMSDIYKTESFSYMAHARYPINNFLHYSMHYRIRAPEAKITANWAESISDLQSDVSNWGLLSAAGLSFVYDSTDNPMKPSYGFRSKLDSEIVGIGGDYHMCSFGYLNSWYYPVTQNTLFKTRADFRYIIPFGSTSYGRMPIDERLFLGGDNQVRGYRPYAIGPKYPNTEQPRGGLSLNLFSMEYIYIMNPRIEGFVFFDAGQLSQRVLNFGALRSSAGFGTRIGIFGGMPPVTVGYGFPIGENDRSDVKKLFFSFGAGF